MMDDVPPVGILNERLQGFRTQLREQKDSITRIGERTGESETAITVLRGRMENLEGAVERIEEALSRFTTALWIFSGSLVVAATGIIAALLARGG